MRPACQCVLFFGNSHELKIPQDLTIYIADEGKTKWNASTAPFLPVFCILDSLEVRNTNKRAEYIGSSFRHGRKWQPGFSLIEMIGVLGLIMIMAAFAVPSLMQTYRSYRLSDGAAQLVGVMDFTRLDAIRRNKPIRLRTAPAGPFWSVWGDSNQDVVLNSGEKLFLTTASANLLPAGSVPGTSALVSAAGIVSPTVLSGVAGSIPFDSRGAVTPAAIYIMYIGTSNAAAGYRAVILMPSGIAHVWAGTAAGVWRQVS